MTRNYSPKGSTFLSTSHLLSIPTRLGVMLLLTTALVLLFVAVVHADSFTVNTAGDMSDVNPGDGVWGIIQNSGKKGDFPCKLTG